MIAAHIVVRLVAPYADPVLLPVVAALNGLGLAVIHRLDLAYEADGATPRLRPPAADLDDPRRGALRRHPGPAPRPPGAAALHLHRGPRRDRAAAAADGAGHRQDVNGARIWIHVGPFSFQPGEVAKVLLVITFAGYLVLHRDALALAGRRVLFVDLPRGRDLGPILAMWLVSLGILVFQHDLGSSLLFFGLFLIMLYVATERPGWLVVGGLLFFGGRDRRRTSSSPTSGALRHLAPPVGPLRPTSTDDRAASSSRRCSAWRGAASSAAASARACPGASPYAESDFIFGAIGEELGLTG